MEHYKYLLGATKNNELVFGEMTTREHDGKYIFSASFDAVMPFDASDMDFEERCEDWLEGFDDAQKYGFCCEYDCAPSELVSIIADDYNIDDIVDCSLYNECFYIDGGDWYFESCSCGQHDTRNEMVEYTNKEAYDALIKLWDKYHLSEMDASAVSLFETVCDLLNPINEEEWIADYIERVII